MGERFASLDVFGFDSHDTFTVGDLCVQPFPVPHDAREPVQFVIGDGAHRVGVLTDIGNTTPYVEQTLSGCDALVLECNHDPGMLAGSDYPFPAQAADRRAVRDTWTTTARPRCSARSTARACST
jgi:phosphoribosyl 1,2-cyclic phosphodiesterase